MYCIARVCSCLISPQSLIEGDAVCNGPELREFLAYEGDSHIAFVKKATEINVPRIDKVSSGDFWHLFWVQVFFLFVFSSAYFGCWNQILIDSLGQFDGIPIEGAFKK